MILKTIIKPRQGGKTKAIIKMSAETQYPIVVRNREDGRAIKRRATEMSLSIPEPISIVGMMRGTVERPEAGKVLIDDADMILNYITSTTIKCDVAALAICKRNSKGHEVTTGGEDVNEKYGLSD